MAHSIKAIPVGNWLIDQCVVFDWFNGPKQGICSFKSPVVEFEFTLLAERLNNTGLDHKLFLLAELPLGTVQKVLALIKVLGEPRNPIWVPIWKFENPEVQKQAEKLIDLVLAQRKPTNIVIYSFDMVEVLGCWKVSKLPVDGDKLFDQFGIGS